MPKAKKEDQPTTIEIPPLKFGKTPVRLLGTQPLIMNRMSEGSKHELWLPGGKKNSAERAATLKHDPYYEFRESMYRTKDDNAPTRLVFPARGFKKALEDATVDIPGIAKAEVRRLVSVKGITGRTTVSIYGIPKIFIAMVRNSDMNHTPDYRTRAIIEEWAAEISVEYLQNKLTLQSLMNLLGGAGELQGVGDNRPGKSGGENGRFVFADTNLEAFMLLKENYGRDAQDEAIRTPVACGCDENESADMLTWFDLEVARREKDSLVEK
jgi:hypothetical protein